MNFESSRRQFIQQGHALNIIQKLPSTGCYATARQYMIEKLQRN